jgi:hypothetical protein
MYLNDMGIVRVCSNVCRRCRKRGGDAYAEREQKIKIKIKSTP